MKKALSICLVIALVGCAALGGPRHIASVTSVTAHSIASTIQDTENLLVCDRPGAPQAPLCVPLETHHRIAALLEQAFKLDGDLAKVIRATPLEGPTPAEVGELTAQITKLINDILALIPKSPAKDQLITNLGGK